MPIPVDFGEMVNYYRIFCMIATSIVHVLFGIQIQLAVVYNDGNYTKEELMADRLVKWAVLGPGTIARKFADGLAGVPGSVLYAVGSRDIARAKVFADTYGAPVVYGSYEELARDPDVDIVYVASPHTGHCEHTLLCLEHGKAVLCEKPMALNAAQARKMAEAARANHVFMMEAMWSRFLPASVYARKLAAEGAIGEVRMLSADFSFTVPMNPESRLFSPALAGGGLLDVGIYVMHLSASLFGATPEKAEAFGHIGPTGVDENAALMLQYPGGKISSLTCGVHAQGPCTASIIGTEGRIELPTFWTADTVRLTKGGKTEEMKFPLDVNGFEYEIREAADCVRKSLVESPSLPLEDTIAILDTMDGFRRQWGLKYPGE